MKIYTFYERNDEGIIELAQAKVAGNTVEWSGDAANIQKIQDMMTNYNYGMLNNQPFDIENPYDWVMAPIIFSGIRFWCTEK